MELSINGIDVRFLLVICPDCEGFGCSPEHNPNDPHENGCSSCPIQVPCDLCQTTGLIWQEDYNQIKENEQSLEKKDELPF